MPVSKRRAHRKLTYDIPPTLFPNGTDIRVIRKAYDMSQREFAELWGISRRRLQYLEAYDQNKMPMSDLEYNALKFLRDGAKLL